MIAIGVRMRMIFRIRRRIGIGKFRALKQGLYSNEESD